MKSSLPTPVKEKLQKRSVERRKSSRRELVGASVALVLVLTGLLLLSLNSTMTS